MALKREKRFFDYKDRIGVSRGGDFDTLQSYSAREAQQFENLMREQSNIAYKEAVERGEERGLLEANKANVVYEDVPITSETGEDYTIRVPKKFTPPPGLSGKTALKVFKEQTHKRYMGEISNTTNSVIESFYSQYAETGIDQQSFNDMLQDKLAPIYEALDPETRNLIKLKDQSDIIQKTNYIHRQYIEKNRELNTNESNVNIGNTRKNTIRKITLGESQNAKKEYKQQIQKDLELGIITPDEAKVKIENLNDEIDSLVALHEITKKLFPSLGTTETTASDLLKLTEYKNFLNDNIQVEFTHNGITIKKNQILKALGKNKENNLKSYGDSIKVLSATSQSIVKKAKNESILNNAIEQYNKKSSVGVDAKYNFGQDTGKSKRTFVAGVEKELYYNWVQSQSENSVRFEELSKNKTLSSSWQLHKLKHGLMSNEQYNSLMSKLDSTDPQDILDLHNNKTLEFFYNFSDNYKHKKDDLKKIQAIHSRLKIARPGQQYKIIEQFLNPQEKIENESINEQLAFQTNDDYKTAKQVNGKVAEYLAEIAGETSRDDILFSTVVVNKILSSIYDNIGSSGIVLSDDFVKDETRRVLDTLDSSTDWGYSNLTQPVGQVPMATNRFFSDGQQTFAKYPPEKNYPNSFNTPEKSELTYKQMTDKYKKFLNKKQNKTIKEYLGKLDFGTYQNPTLRVTSRLNYNNEPEYIMSYVKDGIQHTLTDDNDVVLTFGPDDFNTMPESDLPKSNKSLNKIKLDLLNE
jgi:hypothetical protein